MVLIKRRKSSKSLKPDTKKVPEKACKSTNFRVHLPSELDVIKIFELIFISIAIFTAGCYFVQTVHENERSFSDLSDMEREITFRSEMGFYYYFYKTFVEADSWHEGIRKIHYENFTEHPDTINAFQRFNILPEIIIGVVYRTLKNFNLLSQECFSYKRDDGFVYDTCIGMGEPIFLYLQFAWFSAGFTALFVFYFGFYLSKSIRGGLISTLSYFYNHTECSRIQWAPPLRETFAYPLLLLQMLAVTITLDKKSKYNMFQSALTSTKAEYESCDNMSYKLFLHVVILSILTFLALTFWQFSQFVLFTQFAIVLFLFACGELTDEFVFLFSMSQLNGILLAVSFLQLNDMLMASLFGYVVSGTAMMFSVCKYKKNAPRFLKKIFAILIVPYCTWILRNIVRSEDDNHIFNLLKSKILNFEDFHTLIYTCSPEYNFLSYDILVNLTLTGLLPIVAFILLRLFYVWLKTVRLNRIFGNLETHIVYNLVQCAVFCIMAFLFMRLKLFSNPHLCILMSLVFSEYMPRIFQKMDTIFLFLAVTSGISYNGLTNISTELSNTGTFSYPPLEDLLNFINEKVPTEAVFAGPMATAAAVLLSTHRPIVLHPHYEHAKIRNRTKDVYTIFSRKDEVEVYEKLNALHVDYAIIDYVWCFSKSKMGCFSTGAWDIEDTKNRKKDSFCSRIYENNTRLQKFEHVYKNEIFSLLKLKK